jgi:hypothetical protein
MRNACGVNAQRMWSKCAMHVRRMRNACGVNAQCMWSECAMHVQQCAMHVERMHSACAANAQCKGSDYNCAMYTSAVDDIKCEANA